MWMNSHLGMSVLSEILLTSRGIWLIIDKMKNLCANRKWKPWDENGMALRTTSQDMKSFFVGRI